MLPNKLVCLPSERLCICLGLLVCPFVPLLRMNLRKIFFGVKDLATRNSLLDFYDDRIDLYGFCFHYVTL